MRKYHYTVEAISVFAKVPERTVRRHISEGKLNPDSLISVSEYIIGHKLLGKQDRDGENTGDSGAEQSA